LRREYCRSLNLSDVIVSQSGVTVVSSSAKAAEVMNKAARIIGFIILD